MPSSTEDTATQAQHGVYGTAGYDVAGAAQMRFVPTPVYRRVADSSFAPINRIHQHLCGLHVYAHDPERAVEAHHFCTHLTPDMHQCVIYDSPGPKARLIGMSLDKTSLMSGIEYVITEKLFEGLPADEKKYWHSHKHEVESGMLKLGMKSLVPSALSHLRR